MSELLQYILKMEGKVIIIFCDTNCLFQVNSLYTILQQNNYRKLNLRYSSKYY